MVDSSLRNLHGKIMKSLSGSFFEIQVEKIMVVLLHAGVRISRDSLQVKFVCLHGNCLANIWKSIRLHKPLYVSINSRVKY